MFKRLEYVDETRSVKVATEMFHMRVLIFFLRTLGAWPTMTGKTGCTRENFTKVFLITQSGGFLPLIFLYIKIHFYELNFFEAGLIYITAFMNIVALTRHVLPFLDTYKSLCKKFAFKHHLFYYRNKSEYANKIYVLVNKLCHYFTLFLIIQVMIAISLFNLTPFYNNYASGMFSSDKPENGTYQLAVYFALPLRAETELPDYIVMASFNLYISYFCSACFTIFDLYLSLLIFHEVGHLVILENTLTTFPRPGGLNVPGTTSSQLMFNDEEMQIVFHRLKDLVDYHRVIIEFCDHMSDAFSVIMFIYYKFFQLTCCLLLLECSQLDVKSLMRFGPLTLIVFQQLIQVSVIFELMGSASFKLIDAVYDLPWECMDIRCRRIVHIFLVRVQRPVQLKAMGLENVGVQTMSAILKTSFSYFAFLRTMAE